MKRGRQLDSVSDLLPPSLPFLPIAPEHFASQGAGKAHTTKRGAPASASSLSAAPKVPGGAAAPCASGVSKGGGSSGIGIVGGGASIKPAAGKHPGGGGGRGAGGSAAGGSKPLVSALNDEIDSLFAGISEKKAAKQAAAAEESARAAASAARAQAEAAALSARVAALEKAGRAANQLRGDESPRPLRFDASLGVKVFSIDALKIGAGNGDTKDCPFDCSCCF